MELQLGNCLAASLLVRTQVLVFERLLPYDGCHFLLCVSLIETPENSLYCTGAKKCGTGAIKDMLRLHSSLNVLTKEVHFFDIPSYYNKGLPWYLSQMKPNDPGQVSVFWRNMITFIIVLLF